MPSYGPEVLGPPSRPTDQPHWDPDAQTMDDEQRRELQLTRLRDARRRGLLGRRPAVRAQAGRGRHHRRRRHHHARRHQPHPGHPQAGPRATARPSTRRSGDYRFTPLSDVHPHRPVDRHDRHADGDHADPPRPVARVRVGGPQLVAQRLAAGPGRDPLPSRLPLRRGTDAVGLARVLRDDEPVGGAARHRRARRAGHPHLAAHPPRRADGGASASTGSRRWRPSSASTCRRTAGSRPSRWAGFGRGPAAADDRGLRVLRLPRRARPGVRRRPPARGLGRRPGHRPRHRSRRARRPVGQPRGHHRSTATTGCCATTWRRRRHDRDGRLPASARPVGSASGGVASRTCSAARTCTSRWPTSSRRSPRWPS